MCKACGQKVNEKRVTEVAAWNGWIPIPVHVKNYESGMRSFARGAERINIWLTMMTVATAINHPKKGKTQLYRKHCDMKTLESILRNPRRHTNLGYYKK
jgi:hypothetical protein